MFWHCTLGVKKNIWPVKIEWRGGVRRRLFAYGPADANAIPHTPSSFASFKSRLVLPFWHWLTQAVLETGVVLQSRYHSCHQTNSVTQDTRDAIRHTYDKSNRYHGQLKCHIIWVNKTVYLLIKLFILCFAEWFVANYNILNVHHATFLFCIFSFSWKFIQITWNKQLRAITVLVNTVQICSKSKVHLRVWENHIPKLSHY